MNDNPGFRLDATRSALVIIDLQKGIASRPTAPHDARTVIANAAKLADAFRKKGSPVFLVRVKASPSERLNVQADEQLPVSAQMPPDYSDFVDELAPQGPDIVITKKQWGAFYGTELDLQLRRREIQTIVLCGIATNYGVESTARFAYEYGYQQVFAEDATTSMSAEAHEMSVKYVLRRIGRVRSTEEIIGAVG